MKYPYPAKAVTGAAVLALLLSNSMLLSAQKADSAPISKLFVEIREHATLAEADAETLDAYTRSNVSWQGHANQLRNVKEHVDDLLRDYNEAQRLRDQGSTWQMQAIDQLRPLLQGMADHLSATIKHQRTHQTQVQMKPYQDYVHANQVYAARTSQLIHDLVDYGEAKARSEELEQKLELPASPGE